TWIRRVAAGGSSVDRALGITPARWFVRRSSLALLFHPVERSKGAIVSSSFSGIFCWDVRRLLVGWCDSLIVVVCDSGSATALLVLLTSAFPFLGLGDLVRLFFFCFVLLRWCSSP
ncbi:unnamed protein product, partial [Ixodes hexagonus]